MGLSFTTVAGPRQSSHFQVRVPRHSWPHFTVSDSRLPPPPQLVGQVPVFISPRNRVTQLYPQAAFPSPRPVASLYRMFRSEIDKLRQCVRKVYSRQRISYKPWVDSASSSRYGPKWLFALVMVLSTKTPIMIAMSMRHCNFCLLFTDWRWWSKQST
jgi:hypothetical protein